MAQMIEETNKPLPPLLIVGDGKLAYSVVGNALRAGHETTLLTSDADAAYRAVAQAIPERMKKLILWEDWPVALPHEWVVAVTEECSDIKQRLIRRLEDCVSDHAIIAINMEGIPLEELQASGRHPERILGLNWCYPADLTFFLEIICNEETDPEHVRTLEAMAKTAWEKDPYTVKSGFSVRARMMAAWAREAFFLVENNYASMESIDRACRNDAGYYLPFAGNFRYMDLMGTYAYGVVMKDLNPELSKATVLPTSVVDDFPDYGVDHPEHWEKIVRKFSEEIRELILKYPHET